MSRPGPEHIYPESLCLDKELGRVSDGIYSGGHRVAGGWTEENITVDGF